MKSKKLFHLIPLSEEQSSSNTSSVHAEVFFQTQFGPVQPCSSWTVSCYLLWADRYYTITPDSQESLE